MAYATQSDLSPNYVTPIALVQLTDDEKKGVADVDVVQGALDDASGQVEMYCRDRYSLPLQPTKELVALTCKIAANVLYGRRGGKVPDPVVQAYQDSLRLLRDVAAKKASLDQPVGITDQGAPTQIRVSSKPQLFSHRNTEGYF